MNVVSLKTYKNSKYWADAEATYRAYLRLMPMTELLLEQVKFATDRAYAKELTSVMLIRGRVIYEMLGNKASTDEMRLLAKTNKDFLDREWQKYLEQN